MALSMIVEITSQTPRVTLSMPAMPAQSRAGDDRDEERDDDVQHARAAGLAGERGGGERPRRGTAPRRRC